MPESGRKARQTGGEKASAHEPAPEHVRYHVSVAHDDSVTSATFDSEKEAEKWRDDFVAETGGRASPITEV